MKPGVYITIDVECSMGGAWKDPGLCPVPPSRAVWGEYNDNKFGLPLITDILNRNKLAATFFVEAFMDEQGYPGKSEPICRFLLDKGQDVQLHIHPNNKHYALSLQRKPYPFTDQISDLTPDAQRALLKEGCERITRWTGRPPVAFRAGNMGASEETLEQLAAIGMQIDSSYSFPMAGGQCRFSSEEPYNGSRWYGGVLELALSGFHQARLPGMHSSKPLDLMGISFQECRDAIQRICGQGADAVLILHSFSLFKVRNLQYHRGRPNRVVASRLRRLCQWLRDNSVAYPTRTFAELARTIATSQYQANAAPPCKLTGPRAILRALTRKAVQAGNRFYWA